jgi:probable HAF family extracellular repeat protein
MVKHRIGVLAASFLAITVLLTLSALPARAALKTIDGPNAFETDCNDINTANTIVGFYIDKSGVSHGFALIGTTFKTVDVPGATATLLYGINNHNQAVGWYTDSSGITHGLMINAQLHVTTLDPPGATSTNAWGINDAGEVVGAFTDSSGVFHGFKLVNGTYTTFDAPNGAILTEFTGINNKGAMVGIFDDSGGVEHGFALIGTRFIQIDDPMANGVVTATDRVNDTDEYVGLWGTSTSGPFSGYHAKNNVFTTITFPGSFETRTRGLNNAGIVVGRYTDQSGVVHGYAGQP